MNKLIELLNESAVLDTIFENGYQIKFRATKIISKELGFIKWLVDNDKIDIDKYYEFMTNENIDISNACGELDMDKEFYYELLMILAVQDNSIEFLISILK